MTAGRRVVYFNGRFVAESEARISIYDSALTLPEELRPTVMISCFPLVARLAALAPAYQMGLDLVVPAQRALPGDLLDPTIKTRSRVHYRLAGLQALSRRPGAWAVLVDPDGYLAEGTSGTIHDAAQADEMFITSTT